MHWRGRAEAELGRRVIDVNVEKRMGRHVKEELLREEGNETKEKSGFGGKGKEVALQGNEKRES